MTFSFMIFIQFASFVSENQRKTRSLFISLAKFKRINIGATGGNFKIFNDVFLEYQWKYMSAVPIGAAGTKNFEYQSII